MRMTAIAMTPSGTTRREARDPDTRSRVPAKQSTARPLAQLACEQARQQLQASEFCANSALCHNNDCMYVSCVLFGTADRLFGHVRATVRSVQTAVCAMYSHCHCVYEGVSLSVRSGDRGHLLMVPRLVVSSRSCRTQLRPSRFGFAPCPPGPRTGTPPCGVA